MINKGVWWLGLASISEYLHKAIQLVEPLKAFIISLVLYVMFPDQAYIHAAAALGIAALLDIITKYYALSIKYGGFRNAVSKGAIKSEALWRGTYRKLVSYLVVMILAGLSIRVTMITQVAIFMSTIAYSVMFLRESQSIIENLIDAGHNDLEWFLFWIKKKSKDILVNKEEIKE